MTISHFQPTRGKPKIIITKVPTIDQSSMEFLYPLQSPEKATVPDIIVHIPNKAFDDHDTIITEDEIQVMVHTEEVNTLSDHFPTPAQPVQKVCF
jgi:hypothetical protein